MLYAKTGSWHLYKDIGIAYPTSGPWVLFTFNVLADVDGRWSCLWLSCASNAHFMNGSWRQQMACFLYVPSTLTTMGQRQCSSHHYFSNTQHNSRGAHTWSFMHVCWMTKWMTGDDHPQIDVHISFLWNPTYMFKWISPTPSILQDFFFYRAHK